MKKYDLSQEGLSKWWRLGKIPDGNKVITRKVREIYFIICEDQGFIFYVPDEVSTTVIVLLFTALAPAFELANLLLMEESKYYLSLKAIHDHDHVRDYLFHIPLT